MAARGRFRVAIIADAHFHDPEGDFGLGMIVDGKRLALRCWKDTVAGARAVNESAAVLEAALARVVAAGIRHVILAGDYTDDGQVETTRRLAAFLHLWQARDGLRFYAIPGNHDVFGPHGKHVSARIATTPRTCRTVTSDAALAGIGAITDDGNGEALVSPAMRCLGQPAGLLPMAAFGMFRQAVYLHWETPFGTLDQPEARMYHARSADGSVGHRLMDASYLVEPEAGLWLLMIDANVFEPRPGRSDPTRKKAFHDPSDAGWTALLRVKPFLLPWIADVAARVVQEGCIGETLASLLAAEQAARATDPAIRAALEVIAEDEAQHAELAWRTVAWALGRGETSVRCAIANAFASGLAMGCSFDIALGSEGAFEAHGRPAADVLRAAMARTLDEVIRPVAKAMLEMRPRDDIAPLARDVFVMASA